ncbi:MAG: 30S ribosomal protein S7 [Candidatus Micrarchaeales archaeon]
MAEKKEKKEESKNEKEEEKIEKKKNEEEILIFGKYSSNVTIEDPTIAQYISLQPVYFPHSHGRHAKQYLGKARVNLIERLANKLMRGGTGEKIGGKVIRTEGRLQGKKTKVLKIIKEAFEIIEERTKQNPIQLLVKAVENSAPREDVTRVEYGGVMYPVAVDISALRRVNVALRNIALAAIIKAFGNKKTISEALAEEIILASSNDPNSYAVKRKDEIERIARSAR